MSFRSILLPWLISAFLLASPLFKLTKLAVAFARLTLLALFFVKDFSKRLSLTSALAPGSYQHLRKRLLWSYELKELLLIDLLISIHIDPANDGKVVLLSAFESICIKKSFYIFLVDQAHTYVIDLLESTLL